MQPRIESLIARCQRGWSLPRDFYSDIEVYQTDVQRIWRRGWLFAGHACEIPKPGDFFTVEVDGDPIVVVRDDEGVVHAMNNVCRHRGSLICVESSGHTRRLVCPYHQWTYGLDGRLLACRGMHEEIDKSQ